MTDAAFHEFFLAAAGVSGALIGLLFVAISVAPAATSGKAGHVYQQIRAAAAMSMFLDALMVSLLALIPDGQYLGNGSAGLAIVGLTSTAALVITAARTRDLSHTTWQFARTMVLFAAVLVVYGLQLASALRMNAASAGTGQVNNLAILVVIMFLMGITRAWEIVGATKPRVLGVLAHDLHPANPAGDVGQR